VLPIVGVKTKNIPTSTTVILSLSIVIPVVASSIPVASNIYLQLASLFFLRLIGLKKANIYESLTFKCDFLLIKPAFLAVRRQKRAA
jgi:hypothetical protein